MCPMCMTAIVATLGGFGSAGSITAFVTTKLRLSNRKKEPPKTNQINTQAKGLQYESSENCDSR
jgi:hypothetical protein